MEQERVSTFNSLQQLRASGGLTLALGSGPLGEVRRAKRRRYPSRSNRRIEIPNATAANVSKASASSR